MIGGDPVKMNLILEKRHYPDTMEAKPGDRVWACVYCHQAFTEDKKLREAPEGWYYCCPRCECGIFVRVFVQQ